jgi:hypothetical protein
MSAYSVIHTGANTHDGGVECRLLEVIYQSSGREMKPASDEINAIATHFSSNPQEHPS